MMDLGGKTTDLSLTIESYISTSKRIIQFEYDMSYYLIGFSHIFNNKRIQKII